MTVEALPPYGTAPARTPVQFDPTTGGLRIGEHERRIADPSRPDEVCSAYLSLVYAVRGERPGQRLALRSADLDALLVLVGDDPATIEARLVGLMGCTPEEAGALGALLLRHRRTTAGFAAVGLSLAALALGAGSGGDEPAPPGAVQSVGTVAEPLAGFTGPTAALAPAPAASLVVASAAVADRAPVAAGTRPPVARPVVVVAAPAAAPPVAAEPRAVAPAAGPPAGAPVAPVAPLAPPAEPVLVGAPEDQAYALPTYAEPVLDVPPPPVDEPDSDIGEPAVLDGDSDGTPIGGVVDTGADHGQPGTPPEAPTGVPAELPADGTSAAA